MSRLVAATGCGLGGRRNFRNAANSSATHQYRRLLPVRHLMPFPSDAALLVNPAFDYGLAAELVPQGRQARKEGKFALARERYAEAAAICLEHVDTLAYAHAIRHIADIHEQESNFEKAKSLYEEALKLYRSNLATRLLDLANTVRPYALLNEKLENSNLAKTLWEEARHLHGSLRLDAGVSESKANLAGLRSQAYAAGAS